jgi:hypothetical protein
MIEAAAKHWRALALLALAAAAGLAARAWFVDHRSAAALSATLAASQQQVAAAAAQEKSRDAQLATQLAQIAALEKQVQTPQQALAALPPLPLPITLSANSAQLGPAANYSPQNSNSAAAASAGAAPTAQPGTPAAAPIVPPGIAPVIANIPQQDLKPLYDYLEQCQATTLDRDAARKDLSDAQTQVTALTQAKDAAVASAKGGGFWKQLRRGAKWFAIGAAGASTGGAKRSSNRFLEFSNNSAACDSSGCVVCNG